MVQGYVALAPSKQRVNFGRFHRPRRNLAFPTTRMVYCARSGGQIHRQVCHFRSNRFFLKNLSPCHPFDRLKASSVTFSFSQEFPMRQCSPRWMKTVGQNAVLPEQNSVLFYIFVGVPHERVLTKWNENSEIESCESAPFS